MDLCCYPDIFTQDCLVGESKVFYICLLVLLLFIPDTMWLSTYCLKAIKTSAFDIKI